TEHLLLGLLREAKNVVQRFAHVAPSGKDIRVEIQKRLAVREKVSTAIDLPLSDECKRILHYAEEEAERLNHRNIGTEHLFLAMLREEKCVAAQILLEHGADLNAAREQLVKFPMPDEPAPEYGFRRVFSEILSGFSPGRSPVLPKAGVVSDADSAKR